jgi:hypothetical protein
MQISITQLSKAQKRFSHEVVFLMSPREANANGKQWRNAKKALREQGDK